MDGDFQSFDEHTPLFQVLQGPIIFIISPSVFHSYVMWI